VGVRIMWRSGVIEGLVEDEMSSVLEESKKSLF